MSISALERGCREAGFALRQLGAHPVRRDQTLQMGATNKSTIKALSQFPEIRDAL